MNIRECKVMKVFKEEGQFVGGMFIKVYFGRVGSGLECGNGGNGVYGEEVVLSIYRKYVQWCGLELWGIEDRLGIFRGGVDRINGLGCVEFFQVIIDFYR